MRRKVRPFLLLAAVGLFAVMATTTASAQTLPGDHYFCYKAALGPGQPKFTPAQKTLQDQFRTLILDVNRPPVGTSAFYAKGEWSDLL
jgi:hypothetical protein